MNEKNKNQTNPEKNIADRFIVAMFLPGEYDSLLKLKMRKVISYFCILILLSSVIQYAIPVLGAVAGYGGVRNYILNELPEFSMKNGQLTVDRIIEENNEDVGTCFLINTNVNKFTKDDIPSDMIQAILVSKTNIIMYNSVTGINGIVEEYPFSIYSNQIINNESIAKLAPLVYISMAFVFVLMYCVSYLRFLASGLMYSVFMLIIAKLLVSDLTFGKIYKVSLFAQSVGVIVSAVAFCIGSDVLIMTGSTFGMLVTVMIMNRVLYRHSGKPIDY